MIEDIRFRVNENGIVILQVKYRDDTSPYHVRDAVWRDGKCEDLLKVAACLEYKRQ